MLRLEGVSVSIGAVTILRSVDLEVSAGEFAGLIGRNGAGKTTLLRTIMGLQAPASGRLDFESLELADLPTYRRAGLGIGYMPEDRRLVPGLSAEENILLPAWAADANDAKVQLAHIYNIIPELTTLRARKALQLSGGQQKLVALGRAMMAGRKLLLLDEPFEGVAPVLARRLAEVISGLRKSGLSVILSESSMTHAHGLLDRVFTIDRGSVGVRS
ncbi:ATP-binding cassette domain-containing protein [Bradyrhizobium sp. LMTR 3]|jgi:branched-chain amino acid transport system ATP-binding protein|uniref:ABC transporter ATP-binding protein n=1 Tax=Bradyrhizobium sp. LMTR 3 TaxID=189873 RepID=UPI000810DAE9|nr:ATP-binding cassette domain-containing protein [Bradyrhizobium sp. LMTR 3]OCK56557.1 ABC transporter ATP-binding protein [Bradyrhizobium sp. LMTR 3]